MGLKAQITLEEQMNTMIKAIPAYYFGYSQLLFDNLAPAMAHGSQSQHWKKNWRVKYGLSVAGTGFLVSPFAHGQIDRSILPGNEGTYYLGPVSSMMGSKDPSYIRQYVLTESGERMVNPLTGEFIQMEIEMPGGMATSNGLAPFLMPNVEIRAIKGLVVSGGLIPISYFLDEFEKGKFTSKINFYNYGASLHLRHFFKIPVLSWLRFDASQGIVSASLAELQDLVALESEGFLSMEFTQLEVNTLIATTQYRASMAIPTIKNVILVLQGGMFSSKYSFDFGYDVSVDVDASQLKTDYNIDFDNESLTFKDTYSIEKTTPQTFYYGGGLLLDSKVATFYLGYAHTANPSFLIKTSVRLF